MSSGSVVRARIDADLKRDASSVLADMGLSVSDAIRLLMVKVVQDGAFPFDLRTPNQETRQALQAADDGEVATFSTVDALFQDLREE